MYCALGRTRIHIIDNAIIQPRYIFSLKPNEHKKRASGLQHMQFYGELFELSANDDTATGNSAP